MLGAPGAGKGTQAKYLVKSLSVPHVATGDILRSAVRGGTELGTKAKGYMDAGELVPDEVILGIVGERVDEADASAGFVFDGFPRTTVQADGLEKLLAKRGIALDKVLSLVVNEEALVARLTNRRVCSQCGAEYNLVSRPSRVEGVCDLCPGELMQRDDDREDTIRRRQRVYRDQTAPLVDYYSRQSLLAEVDGGQALDDVRRSIKNVLGGEH